MEHFIQKGRHVRHFFPTGVKRGQGGSRLRVDYFDSIKMVRGRCGWGRLGACVRDSCDVRAMCVGLGSFCHGEAPLRLALQRN